MSTLRRDFVTFSSLFTIYKEGILKFEVRFLYNPAYLICSNLCLTVTILKINKKIGK